MTDEPRDPSVDPQQADGEAEPGSTDWLLAQLSGGRIESRRERREAEAALAKAAAEQDVSTGATPTAVPATQPVAPAEPIAPAAADGAEASDERPKARFSWETGMLEAVPAPEHDLPVAPAAPAPAIEPEPASPLAALFAPAAPEAPVAPAPETATPAPLSPAAALTFDTTLRAPHPAVEAPNETPAAFRWQLAPTGDADPALNAAADASASPEPEAPFVIPAAAPLVMPKPIAPAELAPPAAVRNDFAWPPVPETPTAPQLDVAPEPASEPIDLFAHPTVALPVAPEFVATPVPPLDEFTMPDEAAPSEPTQLLEAPGFTEKAAAAEDPTQLIDTVPGFAGPAAAAAAPAPLIDLPVTAATDAAPGAPDANAGAAPDEHVTSDWSDIADMLGAQPKTVETSIVPQWPPAEGAFDALTQMVAPSGTGEELATAAPAAIAVQPAWAPQPSDSGSGRGPRRGGTGIGGIRGMNRWLLIGLAVLVAVLVGVALFALGRAIANRNDGAPIAANTPTSRPTSPAATPTQTPTTPPAAAAAGPLPAGTYEWDQLHGGECIDPFSGAWDQTFTVVDCTAQHAAQLVYTAPYSADPAAPFPGQNEISSQINLLCSKSGIIDMNAAAAYTDLQIVASYPVTQDQWDNDQRNYYCFVTRSSGQPLSSSVAGSGPTAQ
ncbi:MAG: hypothetical protein FWD85_00530 [Microbacteriaceae bacterium]|nr:hypothetical protein [Microbacteriaceae bacterium]